MYTSSTTHLFQIGVYNYTNIENMDGCGTLDEFLDQQGRISSYRGVFVFRVLYSIE